MTISTAGSIGIGLVIGWLSARRTGLRRPVSSILWLAAALLLIILEVILLSNAEPTMYMVLSAALSFFIHAAWLHELASQYGIHKEV